jgi:hypothetical protein
MKRVVDFIGVASIGLLIACSDPLDQVERASRDIQACEAFQARSNECRDKPEALRLSILEAKKHGISDRQIDAARQLGTSKIKEAASDSPYETLARRWGEIHGKTGKELYEAERMVCEDNKIQKTSFCREREKRGGAFVEEKVALDLLHVEREKHQRDVKEMQELLRKFERR